MPRKLLGNYSKFVPVNIEFGVSVRQQGEKLEEKWMWTPISKKLLGSCKPQQQAMCNIMLKPGYLCSMFGDQWSKPNAKTGWKEESMPLREYSHRRERWKTHPKTEEGFDRGSVQQRDQGDFDVWKHTGHHDIDEGKKVKWLGQYKANRNPRKETEGGTHPRLYAKVGWHLRVSKTVTFMPFLVCAGT